jgi:N-acyl-L-homoserine lactone synthetase
MSKFTVDAQNVAHLNKCTKRTRLITIAQFQKSEAIANVLTGTQNMWQRVFSKIGLEYTRVL